jgi:hypothetical protein
LGNAAILYVYRLSAYITALPDKNVLSAKSQHLFVHRKVCAADSRNAAYFSYISRFGHRGALI